jgi:two-component system sensor histidine kinase KdpD
VNSGRTIAAIRWISSGLCLAAIVTFFHLLVQANQTTIALTLLLWILFLAARWGLRYAVATSVAATLAYNFFFLPPVGQFTVSDPQNVLALFVFLITSIVASRMSNRIRRESEDARARQAELEVLYRLSRALLQTDELAKLTNSIPAAVASATGAKGVLFYLLAGDRIYMSGSDWNPQLTPDELRELSHNPGIISSASARETMIPLRSGVKPSGVLIIRDTRLSHQSLDALGGLVSISLDRASAVDGVTRAEAANESERLRGLMLDSITHELRTPLTAIKASVTTLLDAEMSAAVTRDLLEVIDEESDRLNRLVSQAVEMAQLDTQEVRMSFSPQSLGAMIETAVETYRTGLGDHALSLALPPNLPLVDADPMWIQKLLGNMLENAAKYSAEGKPIFVSAELRGPMVSCSVADRGMGIDPMEQSLIFDKFYRARNRAQHTPGTGMGLAISRAIVEAHGGEISVTSQPGSGSVFTFTLPRNRGGEG